MDKLELKIPPVVVGALAALLMWALGAVAPSGALTIPGTTWLGVGLVCLGAAIMAVGVLTFRASRTTIDPRVPGKATQLVSHGIYRLSRNPMYVGLATILLGWAIQLSNVYALLTLPLFVLYMSRFQIQPEERTMQTLFGDEYTAYTNNVRRWL